MTTTNDQSSREQEIKACPFCGHVGLSFAEGSTFRWLAYSCNGCGISNEVRVQTLGEGTKEEWLANARAEAIKEWNARSPLPPIAITAEEAGREGDAKPVRYEWRHFDTANTPHTWSAWHVVEPRNPYTDTMEDRVREYQGYIAAGYKYELRALYVGLLPPAPAQSGGQG